MSNNVILISCKHHEPHGLKPSCLHPCAAGEADKQWESKCREIEQLSKLHKIPVSNFTGMLTFESTPAEFEKLDAEVRDRLGLSACDQGWHMQVLQGVPAPLGLPTLRLPGHACGRHDLPKTKQPQTLALA